MSYVVQSSENTVKVILNSQLATNGTVKQPKFTLRTPITTPYNQTGLVNLESIALRAPSMFTRNFLNDRDNSIYENTYTDPADANLDTYDSNLAADTGPVGVFGADANVVTDDGSAEAKESGLPEVPEDAPVPEPQSAPKTAHLHRVGMDLPKNNVGSNLYFAGAEAAYSKYDLHTYSLRDTVVPELGNLNSMRSVLSACIGQDMTLAPNLTYLFLNIVAKFRIFEIVIPNMNHETAAPTGSNNMEDVTISWNGSTVVFKINNVLAPAIGYTTLENMINHNHHLRFYLRPLITNNKTYCMQGPWLKLLGVSLDKGYVALNYNYPLLCSLQTGGYDFINMHTNFSRAVYAANQQSEDWQIVPTNIFWTLNIVSEPGKYTYYDNMSSSGKIPFNTPIMEEIEIYFTDKYGDVIDDIDEFVCILTFDFSDKVPAKEPLTTKRARRTLAMF